jgi:hypothetical protein
MGRFPYLHIHEKPCFFSLNTGIIGNRLDIVTNEMVSSENINIDTHATIRIINTCDNSALLWDSRVLLAVPW